MTCIVNLCSRALLHPVFSTIRADVSEKTLSNGACAEAPMSGGELDTQLGSAEVVSQV